MKFLFTSALILSVTASALADHTDFVPKPAETPATTEVKHTSHAPSLYPPYTRNGSRIVRTKSAKQSDTASQHPSAYPPYSRNNPHSQPASTPAVSVAGTAS